MITIIQNIVDSLHPSYELAFREYTTLHGIDSSYDRTAFEEASRQPDVIKYCVYRSFLGYLREKQAENKPFPQLYLTVQLDSKARNFNTCLLGTKERDMARAKLEAWIQIENIWNLCQKRSSI